MTERQTDRQTDLNIGFGSDAGDHVVFDGRQSGDKLVRSSCICSNLRLLGSFPHADLMVLMSSEHFVTDHHHGFHTPFTTPELRRRTKFPLNRLIQLPSSNEWPSPGSHFTTI